MPIIPENYVHTRSTPFWDSCSIPEKLSGRYTTKPSVYGRICVMQGQIIGRVFSATQPGTSEEIWVVKAGEFFVLKPENWYEMDAFSEGVYFNLDFFVDPAVVLTGSGIGQVLITREV